MFGFLLLRRGSQRGLIIAPPLACLKTTPFAARTADS